MPRADCLISWNMKCGDALDDAGDARRRLDLLAAMAAEHTVSLIALQEAPPEEQVRAALGLDFTVERSPQGIATAYSTRSWSCDVQERSDARVLALGLRATGASSAIWIVNVHGPAVQVDDDEKRLFIRTRVRSRLRELRERDAERAEIVAGDLNLAPFDVAVMRADGLHASRCLPWVQDRGAGIERALFNPTWRLFERHDGASGTFYRSNLASDGPWRAFDQILVSVDLATGIAFETVERVGETRLRKDGRIGAPNTRTGSDHLPVLARLTVP